MIKLEHTVFALPFALTGLILGSQSLPSFWVVLWTVLAFTGARAAAMTLNRVIDADVDGKNPRTEMRAIPKQRINRRQAMVFAVASFALMLYAASNLPPICLYLSPIAIVWLSFYSFTKRFTWLCHIVLGIALGGAALGGWVAAAGSIQGFAPWLLALAVSTWVAGFDLIYACQDIAFDQKEKLHSVPAKFGIAAALNSARFLHVVTVSALAGVGITLSLGGFFWSGLIIVAGMLIYEHSIVSPTDLSRVNAAFFNVNGIVSILAFLSVILDRLF